MKLWKAEALYKRLGEGGWMGFTIRKESESLCDGCEYSQRRTYRYSNDSMLRCQIFEDEVAGVVNECSAYVKKGGMTIYDMRKVAWLIDIDKMNKVGFIRPKDRTEEHKKEIADIGR